jgi:hypothetical protein
MFMLALKGDHLTWEHFCLKIKGETAPFDRAVRTDGVYVLYEIIP